MSRKPDPRPGRTKELLWQALLELIQEKRWDRIRVQDILDRTGVGRSTFYAHFDNKFDLLTAEIPSLTVTISGADAEPDLLPLFEHVAEMRQIIWPLMSQPLLSEIMDTFQQRLVKAWLEHLGRIGVPQDQSALKAQMLAGGFMAVARTWLKDGCTTSSEQICADFTRYANAVTAS